MSIGYSHIKAALAMAAVLIAYPLCAIAQGGLANDDEDDAPVRFSVENSEHESLELKWVMPDTVGDFTLDVLGPDGETSLDGYPKEMQRGVRSATVDSLKANTEYAFILRWNDFESDQFLAMTRPYEPFINMTYPGDFHFKARPNCSPKHVTVEVYSEDVEDDITVEVSPGFEVSLDEEIWGEQVTMIPEGETVYIRAATTDSIGHYEGTVTAYSKTFTGPEYDIFFDVSDEFEPEEPYIPEWFIHPDSDGVRVFTKIGDEAVVYDYDGNEITRIKAKQEEFTIPLPPGKYVVILDNERSRKVAVKAINPR